ncbi:SRPBCC domain-containing protein [Psychromicrobium lacuslunae]|uniref:SRPBCC domain-containing protein n=1 Tax=Psychromicrobium lacuslunae TaxID=1618207 RepID=UPI00069804DA|nr:SRPBCC domain-containing protein [Psychromicrobium lacuslunae]
MSGKDLGTLEELEDGRFKLSFRRFYTQPVAVLWLALTDPERTKLWWAEARGVLEAGAAWDLRWQNTPPGEAPMDWWPGTLLEVIPEQVFEMDNSAHGVLRWELRPGQREAQSSSDEVQGTEVRFTAIVDAPDEATRLSVLAGWHLHLDHLDTVLNGGSVDWESWYQEHYPRWQQTNDEYARTVGGST